VGGRSERRIRAGRASLVAMRLILRDARDQSSRYNLHQQLRTPIPVLELDLHPGGCQTAFADGHTRFLSESTNVAVLSAMLTRAGGETVNE
jgi:prepilin-type processing-associated H-X9-DG protein